MENLENNKIINEFLDRVLNQELEFLLKIRKEYEEEKINTLNFKDFYKWFEVRGINKVHRSMILGRSLEGLEYCVKRDMPLKKKSYIAKFKKDIEKKAGAIINAEYLSLNENGGIDGYIIGEKGKFNIQTVFAGGYNIQIGHYRTLIKEYKN